MTEDSRSLQRSIGVSGYFTLSFGAIIGSGWVVVLGEWLNAAGPGGAMLGFFLGGLAILLIGLCYAELAARRPNAGGEFLYAHAAFGPAVAFLVSWFIALYAIAVCAFEGIALAWLLRALIPGLGQIEPLYSVMGQGVTLDALLIGTGFSLLVGLLHYRGAAAAMIFQNTVTYGFLMVATILIVIGIVAGSSANLEPLFETPTDRPWFLGTLWIFATAAYFFNGFQSSLHGIEERRTDLPIRWIVAAMLAGIVVSIVFYCGAILAASSAAPWGQTVSAELPTAAAFRALPNGDLLATLIVAIAAVSLLKTWTSIALLGTRLLFAKARMGLLPAFLARISKHGSPSGAIAFVTACSIVGVFFGRAAVIPIVNMSAICLALSFFVCIGALMALRRRDTVTPAFIVPGGSFVLIVAMICAVVMGGVALLEPLTRAGGSLPAEWLLIAGWGLAGAIAWRLAQRGLGSSTESNLSNGSEN
jgi:APA family basic amino acid/polyamine antiporter